MSDLGGVPSEHNDTPVQFGIGGSDDRYEWYRSVSYMLPTAIIPKLLHDPLELNGLSSTHPVGRGSRECARLLRPPTPGAPGAGSLLPSAEAFDPSSCFLEPEAPRIRCTTLWFRISLWLGNSNSNRGSRQFRGPVLVAQPIREISMQSRFRG